MAAPTRFTISRFANCTSWSHSLNNAQLRQSRNFKTLSSNSRLISGYNVQGNSIYFSKTGAFRHGPSVECSAAPATTLGVGRGQSLRSLSKFTSRSQEITSRSLKRQVRNLSLPFEATSLLQPTNHSHDLFRGIRSRRGTDGLEADVDGEPRRASGPSLAEQEDSAWMLRTSIENVYLSWARNTYIMTVAGATMYGQLIVPYAQEAGVVILLAGGVHLTAGTSLYIYSVLSRRPRMLMSRPTSLLLSSLAVLHAVLWLGAVMVYLGYVEEDDPALEEELRKEEDKMDAQRKQRLRALKRISDKYD